VAKVAAFIHDREWKGLVMALQRLTDWVLNQIIQDVTEGDGLCEYDCRKGQCSQGEWETCERRLNRASGELMPARENRRVATA
jgi:hypothetical protein